MKAKQPTQAARDYPQLERQRKALRSRLYRMLDELEGRPVDHRSYQPFSFGALEKVIEDSLRGLEDLVRRLLIAIEKQATKPRGK